jgi:hypothetical protein
MLLFQFRFTDMSLNSLKADEVVGRIKWPALFGIKSDPVIENDNSSLLSYVLDIARSQVGVMEEPSGSNSGPEVNKYHDAVGIPHGDPWSIAFIYWCFSLACNDLKMPNPLYKAGRVIDVWNYTEAKKILAADVKNNTSLILPGQIFIISTGGIFGHAGFIDKVDGDLLTTIEGNTNTNGSDKGIGVYRRTARTISSINVGFIQF